MKKKKLRKKLADVTYHNDVLTKENESLAAEIERMTDLFTRRTTEYSETIKELREKNNSLDSELVARLSTFNSLQKQNKTLKEHVAYLERIKLYGKVTASETLDASHESIAELPIDNKGTLGIH